MISEEILERLSNSVCTQTNCKNESDLEHLWGQLVLSYKETQSLLSQKDAMIESLKLENQYLLAHCGDFEAEIKQKGQVIEKMRECLEEITDYPEERMAYELAKRCLNGVGDA